MDWWMPQGIGTLKVREDLCKLGGRSSKLGLLYFYKGQALVRIILLFVDELLWGGKSLFTKTIQKLKVIFQVGSENQKSFTYICINLKKNQEHSIIINQIVFTETIQLISVTKEQICNSQKSCWSRKNIVMKCNWTLKYNCLTNCLTKKGAFHHEIIIALQSAPSVSSHLELVINFCIYFWEKKKLKKLRNLYILVKHKRRKKNRGSMWTSAIPWTAIISFYI